MIARRSRKGRKKMAIIYLVSMITSVFTSLVLLAQCAKYKAENDRERERYHNEVMKLIGK